MNLVRTSTRVIAAIVACTATAALLGGGPAAEARGGDPAGPDPALQTIALAPAAGASPAPKAFAPPGAARAEAAAAGMAVSPRATLPFSLLGLTWTDPRAALDGTVEVRTRSATDGRWTAWQALEADEPNAADPGTERGTLRGSTDPLWVGASDAVEARVASTGGAGPLPAGLRLELINPDAINPDQAVPESAPAARAAAATPIPKLITRAGWRANETIVQNPPEYSTDVQVMFVHHTATSNNYTCNQSATIIRGIEAYHVRSKGWNDIGYNFLVDKCGNLFEGRKGGVDRPVLGAHTLGFNAHSSAIAVIGNYTGAGAPAVVRNVIAQVAAYKVGMYGHNPAGSAVLVSNGSDRYPKGKAVTLARISGHRDTGRTECPGDALYGQLGTIRTVAGSPPAGLGLLRMTGAVKVGSRFFTRGLVSPLWSLRTPSAMLNRFDVFVDGIQAGSASNTSRTWRLRLAPGSHTVTIRAMHLNGTHRSVTAGVVADATAPVFSPAPVLQLRPGSLASAVPTRLLYTVADAGGLRSVGLTRPSAVNLGVATRSYPGFARPGVATTWTVRAADWAGNTAAASVTGTPVVVAEAAAARTGHWRKLTDPRHLGGRALISATAGATMSWTFTGSAGQLAVARTTGSGRVRVYLDGSDYGVLDLRASRTIYRNAVYAPHWNASGQHTLTVRVEGTTGRPGVIIDGMVRLG